MNKFNKKFGFVWAVPCASDQILTYTECKLPFGDFLGLKFLAKFISSKPNYSILTYCWGFCEFRIFHVSKSGVLSIDKI